MSLYRSLLLATIAVAPLVACDEPYDPTKAECGYAGNGCWNDETCNVGYRCNTARKNEPLKAGVCQAKAGVCEPIPVDAKVTVKPDGAGKPDGTVKPDGAGKPEAGSKSDGTVSPSEAGAGDVASVH